MDNIQTAKATAPRDAKKRWKSSEWVCLGALVAWGYMVVQWFPLPNFGARVPLFALAAVAIAFGYLWAGGKRPARASYGYLSVLLLLALSFALFENSGILAPLFLLLPCLFACWLLHAAQARPLAGRDIVDSLFLLAAEPFAGLGEKSAGMMPRKQEGQKLTYVLWGIGITTPVLMVALYLLTEADERFSLMVHWLMGAMFDDLGAVLGKGVAACMIAAYLLSMLMGALHAREKGVLKPLPRANGTVMSILVGALCALYSAFVAVQCLSVVWVLSQDQSASFYSGYVRDGFFELCLTTVLNLAVFLAGHLFRERGDHTLRWLLTALGLLTQALIITAGIKMGLYMSNYGLTLLRVQTLWFMVSLFVAFGVLTAMQWKCFPGFKALAVFAAVSILAASYANIGGMVAGVNVRRYLEGSIQTVSLEQYGSFPYEAAPHLIRLCKETSDGKLRAETEAFLADLHKNEEAGWSGKSVQQALAEAELATFAKEWPGEK